MSDAADIIESCSGDAMKWAEAFCQTYRELGGKDPSIEEGWLVGWFANAMEMRATIERKRLLNTPELADFTKGVILEAQHQRERWGDAHDRSKSAENWYWLVGYLAGKALRAAIAGDQEKAMHHTISTAAALSQWHEAIKADEGGDGVWKDSDLRPYAEGKS